MLLLTLASLDDAGDTESAGVRKSSEEELALLTKEH